MINTTPEIIDNTPAGDWLDYHKPISSILSFNTQKASQKMEKTDGMDFIAQDAKETVGIV